MRLLLTVIINLSVFACIHAQDTTITIDNKTRVRDIRYERRPDWKKPDVKSAEAFDTTKRISELRNNERLRELNQGYAKKKQDWKNDSTDAGKVKHLVTNAQDVKTKQVYSEKSIDHLCDSLAIKNMNWAAYKKVISSLKESDADLAKAVSKRFPEFPTTDKYAKNASQLNSINSTSANGIKTDSLLALSEVKLPPVTQVPDSVLTQLKPLQGRQISSKYLDQIEKLRKLNLKEEGLKLKEEKDSQIFKSTIFQEKGNFWRKNYFEGIIGVLSDPDNFTIVQASPSFGHHLAKNFSLGLGTNLQVKNEHKSVNMVWGLRSFAKYEFVGKKIYAQLEDIISFPNLMLTEGKKKGRDSEHAVLLGGGYLLALSESIALNFSLLYRITDSRVEGSNSSPWVLRIGISSFGKTKKVKR